MILPSGSAADEDLVGWKFDNTYARLPNDLFASAQPMKVRAPQLLILNHRLAAELGLNFNRLSPESAAAMFAGQNLPPGALPIAQAYAGHQFGSLTMLGDGRAILLGEHRTPSARLVDIQLKGAGPTKFSRRGDGLAVLGPMLREYVISEAMVALGIPTTQSLAVVTTGEPVYRAKVSPGAVLTRVAAGHVRVGTFQFAAATGVSSHLRALADYAIDRHYPELVDVPQKYLQFFRAVMDRQASLIARWQLVGFIHGVMNTDNMAISGETLDYGPCAFMNTYDPDTVFSSIDHAGRYAYGNQPAIAQWNLGRFVETLLPLLDSDAERAVAIAVEALGEYRDLFEQYWLAGMRKKLGLHSGHQAGDLELFQALLAWMQESRSDFTNTFRDLSYGRPLVGESYQSPTFQTWHAQWQQRRESESTFRAAAYALMRAANPTVIPRNHRVEEALSAAENGDLSVLHRLLAVLASPYESGADAGFYQERQPDDGGYQTFCGT